MEVRSNAVYTIIRSIMKPAYRFKSKDYKVHQIDHVFDWQGEAAIKLS